MAGYDFNNDFNDDFNASDKKAQIVCVGGATGETSVLRLRRPYLQKLSQILLRTWDIESYPNDGRRNAATRNIDP